MRIDNRQSEFGLNLLRATVSGARCLNHDRSTTLYFLVFKRSFRAVHPPLRATIYLTHPGFSGGKSEIGRILHLKFESRNCSLNCVLRPSGQVRISDFCHRPVKKFPKVPVENPRATSKVNPDWARTSDSLINSVFSPLRQDRESSGP